MTDFTNHTNDGGVAELDARVRESVTPSELAMEQARERSFAVTASALDDAIAAERAGRGARVPGRLTHWLSDRGRLIGVSVAALAVGVFVVGALVPGSSRHSGSGGGDTVPSLGAFAPTNASAAEVLRSAAIAVTRADGGAVGSGPVWYSATATTGTGVETLRSEQWVNEKTGAAHSVTLFGSTSVRSDGHYYVTSVSPDGAYTIRQYDRAAGSTTWKPSGEGTQMDGTVAGANIGGAAPVELSVARWLRAVSAAKSDAEVTAATATFKRDSAAMLTPPSSAPRGSAQEQAITGIMQARQLLQSAQLSDRAVAMLYRDLAAQPALERLADGTIDGRATIRLRLYPAPADANSAPLQNVLVIDAKTGRAVAMETEDGSARIAIAPARRLRTLDAHAQTCGAAGSALPPCELLRGVGPVAAAAAAASVNTDPMMSQPGQ